MNRLVREHYPVSKLPEDLRNGLQGLVEVTITIDSDASPEPVVDLGGDENPVPRPGLFSDYKHLVKPRFTTDEEIDDHVRALREEWDHRER